MEAQSASSVPPQSTAKPPSWKQLLVDAFFVLLLLILTHVLTNIAPIVNRWFTNEECYQIPETYVEPLAIMAIYMWIVPGVVLGLVTLFLLKDIPRTLYVLFVWVQANVFTIFVTALFRYFLPEPRPSFSTKCLPTKNAGFLLDTDLCQQRFTRRDIQSFPSGHASLVWTTYIFIILVLTLITGTFARLRGKNSTGQPYFWKLCLFFLPMLLIPIWVSCNRVVTGNHHMLDVAVGSLIGILLPFFVFFNMQRDYVIGGRVVSTQPSVA